MLEQKTCALSHTPSAVYTHIDFGGLRKSPNWVNMIVENDDPHHHPHAEQHGVCVGEPAAVFPAGHIGMNIGQI